MTSIILHPFDQNDYPVFIKISEDKPGNLSITGVVGPMHNGNAAGSAGQINMEYAHRDPADNDKRYSHPIPPSELKFAPGWDAEKWLKLLDIWERWHLNDMRPDCKHQRALGWHKLASKEVKLYHYTLKHSFIAQQNAIKDEAMEALKRGDTFTSNPEIARILSLPYSITLSEDNPPEEYEPKKHIISSDSEVETKTLGWLRPEEHPEGLLCRPCPTCGYKYGTAWLYEPIPQDVMDFINSLPETDLQPAWV